MGHWFMWIVILLMLLAGYVLIKAIRVARLSPEERQKRVGELKAKQAELVSKRTSKSMNAPSDNSTIDVSVQSKIVKVKEENINYEPCNIVPTPWDERVIYTDEANNKYFVVWAGHGPETEFSIKRKRRVSGHPIRLMKGFDSRMYITIALSNNGGEETFCYDSISSQIKSVGYAGGSLLAWANSALGFNSVVLDALPFDNSTVNLESLWLADTECNDISFTYRSGDERIRVTVTPKAIFRNKITGGLLISVLDNSTERQIGASNIETQIAADWHKKMPIEEWVEFMCQSKAA